MASIDAPKVVWACAVLLGLACGPGAGEDEGAEATSTSDSSSAGDASSASSASSTPGNSATSSLDGMTETTTAAPSCDLPPVDPKVVDTLRVHSPLPDWLYGDVPAGSGIQLYLGYFGATFPETIIPVSACAEWSVEPTDGVSVDATGMLFVDAAVRAGTTFTVTADVEDGRRVTTADFTVYPPVSYDILGRWSETQRLACDGGAPFEPDPAIAELVIYDNGEFTVSWTAFEGLINYWGTFTYDERTSALVLAADRHADYPEGFEGEGTASVVDGQLVLEGIWLGLAQGPKAPPDCGHVFEQASRRHR